MAAKKSNDDLGASEVAEKVEADNAQGFHGIEVDKTPNENYTVAGVLAGKPTTENDPTYKPDEGK